MTPTADDFIRKAAIRTIESCLAECSSGGLDHGTVLRPNVVQAPGRQYTVMFWKWSI